MISEMYRMGYRGEIDGHGSDWHASTARSHSDMRDLMKGREHARIDMAADLKAFEEELTKKRKDTQ